MIHLLESDFSFLQIQMFPNDFLPSTFTPHKNAVKIDAILERASFRNPPVLHEFEAYDLFSLIDVQLPAYRYFELNQTSQIKSWMKPKQNYVIKCHIPGCLHKTDIGGVELFINQENVDEKVKAFTEKLLNDQFNLEGVIVVEMVSFHSSGMSNGELLISTFSDETFGPSVCFGLGGTAIEYYGEIMDKSQIFLPVFLDFRSPAVAQSIERLPCTQFLLGNVRGSKKQVDSVAQIQELLMTYAELARYYSTFNQNARFVIDELEINPVVVSKAGVLTALDGVVRVKANPNFKQDQKLLKVYEATKPLYKLGYLFGAQSVCVIGASSKNADNPATVILNKYLKIDPALRPKLCCIHPKEQELLGVPCFNSIDQLISNNKPDLIILGTAAESTAQLIQEIIAKNACKAVFTLAGGFAETEAGAKAEAKLRALIADYNANPQLNAERPVINGPNTVGYKYVATDKTLEVNTVFLASYKSSGEFPAGHDNAALIAQSGAFMITRISNLNGKVAPRFCMSVGNQMCVTACDCLEWLLTDQLELSKQFGVSDESELIRKVNEAKKGIQVYGIYVEGLLKYEGIRLLHLVARARAAGKLVVLYKAGRSKQGSAAVAGHTASMAGSYSQFFDLLDMAGAVVADTADAFEDALFAGCCLVDRLYKMPKGHKISLSGQSNAGFERCQMADHLFCFKDCAFYTKLVDFSPETEKCLKDLFTKHKLDNVIDVQQILDTTALFRDPVYEEISTALLEAHEVDAACITLVSEIHMIKTLSGELGKAHGEDCENDPDSVIQRYIKLYKTGIHKPWVFATSGGWKYDVARETMIKAGLPVFPQCDRAARALAALVRAVVGRHGYAQ